MKRFYRRNNLLLGLTVVFLSGCVGEMAEMDKTAGEDVAADFQQAPFQNAEPKESVRLPEGDMAFYWYEGKKMGLSKSTARRAVRYAEKTTPQTRKYVATALNAGAADAELEVGNGIFLYAVGQPSSPSAQPMALNALSADASELTVYDAPSGNSVVLTEEFHAQFKAGVTRQQIDAFNLANKVRMVSASRWEVNAFLLAVQKEAGVDALTMANRYYDSGMVVYASPNFVQLVQRTFVPNDTYFPQQWALNNTAQGGRGIVGQDIRAVAAWDITRGAATVTIAIIDEGVDYTHPDLNTPGKLVTGYDAMRKRDNPNPINRIDNHGTACAGIAAAAGNNGLGISGVAPGSRIMGVRIADPIGGYFWSTTNEAIADGIATAANRGADILSNSWGGGAPSSVITNAIRHAKTHGRGGRGALVIAAAGNDNGPVIYPANQPEVFAVAACNQWGERKSPTSRDGERWGSSFGPQVDICAPGLNVYTTDNAGAYLTHFNGTSSSTPHVAGVAALVLSVNPNLTAAQVEQILRNSANDVAPPGRDDYTGYGFVNALRAVQAAGGTPPGNTPSCTLSATVSSIPQTGGTYTFSAANCTGAPTSYTWTVNGVTQGSRTGTMSYAFPANTTTAARSFTLSLTATNSTGTGEASQLVLSQPGVQRPSCTLSATVSSIPQTGGTYTFSATNCTGAPTSYTWTVNGVTQGSRTGTMSYVFPANTTTAARSFTLSLTATNSTGTGEASQLVLSQPGLSTGNTPLCAFVSSSTNIPGGGGTYTYYVACTGSPTSYEWTVNGQRVSTRGNALTYGFPANNTSAARSFIITVVASNNAGASNTAQMTVNQPRL